MAQVSDYLLLKLTVCLLAACLVQRVCWQLGIRVSELRKDLGMEEPPR